MPAAQMIHDIDPKQVIYDKLGSIPSGLVWRNLVLVAVYERPEKTKGGIILTDSTRDEDQFQGKVGLVVQLGPQAFVDTEAYAFDDKAAIGDWVWFRTSNSFPLKINGKICRVIRDDRIDGRVPDPDMVW
jgi:co-chaperonin GroES (HSP10)